MGHRRRDLGGLIFIDLRDRTGLVQLPSVRSKRRQKSSSAHDGWVRNSWLAWPAGSFARPVANINPELATGEVEVRVSDLTILNEAETPAIPVAVSPGDELPAEDLRLRYRYLDLRRDDFQRALAMRHRATCRSCGAT